MVLKYFNHHQRLGTHYMSIPPFVICCCCFLLLLSLVWLCETPMDCIDSSVCGISQQEILEWVAISFSRGSSQPRDWTHVFCLAGRFFTTKPPRKPNKWINKSRKCSDKGYQEKQHKGRALRGGDLSRRGGRKLSSYLGEQCPRQKEWHMQRPWGMQYKLSYSSCPILWGPQERGDPKLTQYQRCS